MPQQTTTPLKPPGMQPALETLHAMRLMYWALNKHKHYDAVRESISALKTLAVVQHQQITSAWVKTVSRAQKRARKTHRGAAYA